MPISIAYILFIFSCFKFLFQILFLRRKNTKKINTVHFIPKKKLFMAIFAIFIFQAVKIWLIDAILPCS
jgi:hypothetical protein